MQIFETLCDIIRSSLRLEEDFVLTEETGLLDIGADSLDVVEIIMSVEDAFDITVPEGEEEKFQTIGDAVRYIESLLL